MSDGRTECEMTDAIVTTHVYVHVQPASSSPVASCTALGPDYYTDRSSAQLSSIFRRAARRGRCDIYDACKCCRPASSQPTQQDLPATGQASSPRDLSLALCRRRPAAFMTRRHVALLMPACHLSTYTATTRCLSRIEHRTASI